MVDRTRADQKGFSLVELLIAISIAALVTLGAVGVMVQLLQSGRASGHMDAIRQVQMAGWWISWDGLQAENVSIGPSGNGFPCTFESHDYTAADAPKRTVVYSLIPMNSGSLAQLEREVTIGDAAPTTTIVAWNLVTANNATSLSWTDSYQTACRLQVASTSGQKTENRTYEVTPRPAGKL